MSFGNKAEQVLAFIKQYQADQNGVSPSLREIADGTGIKTTSHVNYYISQLINQHKLMREKGKSRSLVVLSNGRRVSPPAPIVSPPMRERSHIARAPRNDEPDALKQALKPLVDLWKPLLAGRNDGSIFTIGKHDGQVKTVTVGQMRALVALIEE